MKANLNPEIFHTLFTDYDILFHNTEQDIDQRITYPVKTDYNNPVIGKNMKRYYLYTYYANRSFLDIVIHPTKLVFHYPIKLTP
jgi:hypothetical protein